MISIGISDMVGALYLIALAQPGKNVTTFILFYQLVILWSCGSTLEENNNFLSRNSIDTTTLFRQKETAHKTWLVSFHNRKRFLSCVCMVILTRCC